MSSWRRAEATLLRGTALPWTSPFQANHSFIHAFSSYLLSTSCMPGTVLGFWGRCSEPNRQTSQTFRG